jgi:hypothetical protein
MLCIGKAKTDRDDIEEGRVRQGNAGGAEIIADFEKRGS